MIEFQEFNKIPRYRREMIVTEKIDGTNAAVVWAPLPCVAELHPESLAADTLFDQHGTDLGMHQLLAQSRTKFITPASIKPKNDNHGFAQWVQDNALELRKLGPGYHFGEWWGFKIQRTYGMTERRFSLFNVKRWGEGRQERPACCHVVPIIGSGTPADNVIDKSLELLAANGSVAAPGYMKPEGVVVYHVAAKQYFKVLLENDDVPKGKILMDNGGLVLPA